MKTRTKGYRRFSVLLDPRAVQRLEAVTRVWARTVDKDALDIEIETLVRVGIKERWADETRRFQRKAHAWFHRAAPLRSSNRDDVGIFPAVGRGLAVLALALAAASGCGAASGFGESTADVCREALAHRDARARVCGDSSVSDVSQCDSVVWIPRSEGQQEACFRALDMLDCKALRTMPDACVGLFPPWQ